MIKKRYIVILCVILLIILGSIINITKPVLPFIQLPGETYPGSYNWPIVGTLFDKQGLTNTFMASLVAYALILILIFLCEQDQRRPTRCPPVSTTSLR